MRRSSQLQCRRREARYIKYAREWPAKLCKDRSDVYRDHAISCAIGGERIARNVHLCNALYQTAQQAHLRPRKEPDSLIGGMEKSHPISLFRFGHTVGTPPLT